MENYTGTLDPKRVGIILIQQYCMQTIHERTNFFLIIHSFGCFNGIVPPRIPEPILIGVQYPLKNRAHVYKISKLIIPIF